METDEKHHEQRKRRMNMVDGSVPSPTADTVLNQPPIKADGDRKVLVEKRSAYWILVHLHFNYSFCIIKRLRKLKLKSLPNLKISPFILCFRHMEKKIMKLLKRWVKLWRKKTPVIQHVGKKKCKSINYMPIIISNWRDGKVY